ncbi:hypothetical protein BJX65DRAFT_11355 [Aspergillus insuetus]
MLLSFRPAVHDGEVQRGTRKHGLNIPKVPSRRRLERLPDSKVWIRLFTPRKGNDARRVSPEHGESSRSVVYPGHNGRILPLGQLIWSIIVWCGGCRLDVVYVNTEHAADIRELPICVEVKRNSSSYSVTEFLHCRHY